MVQDVTKIGDASLWLMQYQIVNGKIFQKSAKGNKLSMEQKVSSHQEASINLEYCDYDISETPSLKDLLKDIIKKQAS